MSEMICYCFGYTKGDIKEDLEAHGESLLLARIITSKKAGNCRCASENPKGR